VPTGDNAIRFAVEGPSELVATDNGNPMDRTGFGSPERNAFSGLALAIVRAEPGRPGEIAVTAIADGLTEARIVISAEP
jgi:beta-galactosidase